jgi:Uma2 family endonuclease
MWEHAKPPELVIEIVSNKVGKEFGDKKKKYAHIGVWYYVVYDPELQVAKTALSCYELHAGKYKLIKTGNWYARLGN